MEGYEPMSALTGKCNSCGKPVFCPDVFQDVVDFHEKYGIQYDGKPRHLEADLEKFRIARLEEELTEYKNAKTLAEKLDALVDLQYILLGTAHLHGFDRFNEAWERVHSANMAKELSHPGNPGKYGAIGRDIVKPPGWASPNHSDLVGE
jgi:predicted HAD superfamily Cof-like phosphohydrolase